MLTSVEVVHICCTNVVRLKLRRWRLSYVSLLRYNSGITQVVFVYFSSSTVGSNAQRSSYKKLKSMRLAGC